MRKPVPLDWPIANHPHSGEEYTRDELRLLFPDLWPAIADDPENFGLTPLAYPDD